MDGNSVRDNWMYGERERERGGRAGFSGDDPLHVLVFWFLASRICHTADALIVIRICTFEFKFVGGGGKES